MNSKNSSGFTLIEVLVSIFLIALVLVSLARNQMQMAKVNSDSNLQLVEAAVAEAASYRYGGQLLEQGFTASGNPETDFASLKSELTGNQQAVLGLLAYEVRNVGGTATIRVYPKASPEDPRQLIIEVK